MISISCSNLILPLMQLLLYLHMYMYHQLSFVCQHKSNVKKNVNTKKFPWKIHLYCLVWVFIYFIFQGDDTTFYIQNMNVLNEKSFLSQHTPLIVTKPPFYTCFHDVQLSLILSYQFNHVHYFLIDILWVRKSTKRNPD